MQGGVTSTALNVMFPGPVIGENGQASQNQMYGQMSLSR